MNVRLSRNRKAVAFIVFPANDQEIKVVAMLQALLSEGLAELIRDGGKQAEIQILPESERCTRAGLQAQIVPLLPFASRYTRKAGGVVFWDCFRERMQFGKVPSDVDEGTSGQCGDL